MSTKNLTDCQATTAKGTDCTRMALVGGAFCKQHAARLERVEEVPLPTVCQSCIDAVEQEFSGFFVTEEDIAVALIENGPICRITAANGSRLRRFAPADVATLAPGLKS